jgi:NAD+ kinase
MESPKELNKIITKFNKPLIVFRIRTPKIYDVTIEMIKYLIDSGYVEYVYLENPDKIKNDPVFQDAKYDKYLKNFVAETQDSNICIIIGGDGTCLWANQLYKDKPKPPFFCFHGGNLGFLAVYEPENYKKIFDELYKVGEYNLINRKEINCTVYKKKDFDKNKKIDINDFEGYEKIAAYNALNELILEKKKNMSHLYIFLKDKFLAKVSSDGFIASTPTGSTAYSLSAGGPILHNDVQGIIISAICPFSLSFRPIVLPTNVKLRIKNNFEKEGSESIIKIDGNDKGSLNDDMYLEASLSDETIDFILLKSIQESQDTLWIQKLSKSLGWNYAFNH